MKRVVHPGRTAIYAPLVLDRVPALLSMLDRDPASLTYGSFDRDHWAWKFRDFPLGMLQSALYPLALLWRFPIGDRGYHGNPRLLEWIVAGIRATIARQHRNGAFDAFAPNEQDPGPTMGVTHALVETFDLIRGADVPGLEDEVRRAACAAAEFARSRHEQHAFVSNHWALIAVAFHDVGTGFGHPHLVRHAATLVDRILAMQSRDGWYHEYGGPDPGYESLGIFHLAVLWKKTGDARLLDSLRRSVECYAHFVHPDGSVGGVYGARNTSLYFPGGFELLAAEIPAAAGVAAFMGERLGRGNVVTPVQADAENLPSLAYAYLEACLVDGPQPPDPPPVPAEALDGPREFPDAGIAVAGVGRTYCVVNGRKGGVCRVFDRAAGRLAYEDAGYIVRGGRRRWVTQRLGAGEGVDVGREGGPWRVVATFQETAQIQATPAAFVLLRLLNLTLFRSLRLGQWIRTLIVRRLITRQRPGPFRLCRELTVGGEGIAFVDRIERAAAGPRVRVDEVLLARGHATVHMGSARYYHPAELAEVPAPSVAGVAAALNETGRAEVRFTLRLGETGAAVTVDRAGVA